MPDTQSDRLREDRPLTTGAVADLLAVTPNTVRAMCERGELPGAIRIGNWWRIPAEAVSRYLPQGAQS